MIRRRIALIFWVLALSLFVPGAVHAYIDPATTTYLIQIVTALVVTLGVSLSIFLYRFHMISAKIKYGLFGMMHRLRQGGLLRRRAPFNDGVGAEPDKEGPGSGLLRRKAPRNDETGRDPLDSEAIQKTPPEYVIPGAAEAPSESDMATLGVMADIPRIEPKTDGFCISGKGGYFLRRKAALPAVLAVCLSFIIFGCIDLMAQNAMDMPFLISEAFPIVALCFACCFVVLLFFIPLFKGRVFEVLLSLAVSVLIAGYIQGNYLNTGLGELTGDEIVWGVCRTMMISSSVFWLCLFAAVFLLLRFARPVWRKLAFFAPWLLIIIQAVALVPVLGTGGSNQNDVFEDWWGKARETLSIAGLDELASEKNTVVFILDRLDEEFVKKIEDMDPHFFDRLDGFTKFEDNISYYVSTFPSVTSMLTGHKFYFEGPVGDYFSDAWANAKMVRELKARGVDIKLYTPQGYTYGSIDQLQGLVSNIIMPEYDFSARIALVKLLKLSAFRYAPMPAKQVFWISPTEFSDAIYPTSKASPYITNDFAFYEMLLTERLKKTDEAAAFAFIHLLGAHDPIRMDENIQYSESSTAERQAMGAFRIVYEYIDQMKAFGLYEDATIIITGDHGVLQGDGVERPALTGLFVKPAGSYGTPLEYSYAPVSPEQLAATVITGMFGKAEGYGQTYFDVSEGDDVIREYITDLKHYEISGDGRVFDNWRYIGTLENKSDW